jgi:hypothetical protein
MIAGEDLARTAVTAGVTAALAACGMPRLVAGLAGRAAADTLMKLTPVRHWEDVRRAVQLLAVSMCPNVADHPEVEQYCLRPLASELLSSEIQEELGPLPLPDRLDARTAPTQLGLLIIFMVPARRTDLARGGSGTRAICDM